MSALSPLRTGRITASRVAAILGVSPYASRADVLREMVRQYFGAEPEFTGNDATRYGQDREPHALARYEQYAGMMTHGNGELVIHPKHDFLAATPDGLVGEDGLVECKAPFRATYTDLEGAPYYRPQIQLQLAVTGRSWCDFAILGRNDDLAITREEVDLTWLTTAMPALLAFMDDYHTAIASAEAAAPHLAPRVAERDDAEWSAATAAWREAKAMADAAGEAEAAARERLIHLANGRSSHGGGLTLARSERKGNVNYAKVPELAGVDLEQYRGKSSVVWTIRQDKEYTA